MEKDKGKSVIPHVVVVPSKMRIFLCDTHGESFRETLALLCKLSYKGEHIYAWWINNI